MSLAALQTNAARLTQRITESISESTRDISALGSVSISAGLGLDGNGTSEERAAQIKKQLDSNSEREKLDALKKLLATLSKPALQQSFQQSTFFPLVVKNVASNSLEVRKLVYIYLLRFAHLEPDLALLSINTFQKDLTDSNPLIRAMALRVLSGIGRKVNMIQALVQMSVKKCAADPSPYVRKSAAFALIKCYEAEPVPSVHTPVLDTLLTDTSPLSLGATALATMTIAPSASTLLHRHYRRFCAILPDIDAWGQCYMTQLLGHYARANLRRPQSSNSIDPDLDLLLQSSRPLLYSRNPATVMAAVRLHHFLGPPDSNSEEHVQPLLRLLHNPPPTTRVVLSYIHSLVISDPTAWAPHISAFIIRANDNPSLKDLKMRILLALMTSENIKFLQREFADYVKDADPDAARAAVQALGICALRGDSDGEPEKVLLRLVDTTASDDIISSTAVTVLLSLITHLQTQPDNTSKSKARRIIVKLAKAYLGEKLQSARARGCVLWIVGSYAEVGENAGEVEDWAPDVLRIAAREFSNEPVEVRLHTLSLASKLAISLNPSSKYHDVVKLLSTYTFSLAQRDKVVSVRDRARFLVALLEGAGVIDASAPTTVTERASWDEPLPEEPKAAEGRGGVILRREQVRVVLLRGIKSVPLKTEEERRFPSAPFGSLSSVLDRDVRYYDEEGIEDGMGSRYPEWCEEPSDPSLRNIEVPAQPQSQSQSPQPQSAVPPRVIASGSGSASPVPGYTPSPAGSMGKMRGDWTDLDKFYESDQEEEASEEEEESEEEASEDEDEDEDDEDEKADIKHAPSAARADGEVARTMKEIEENFYD